VIVQVPDVTGVTVTPLTVHTLAVVDAKLTVKPELAVAVNAKADAGSVIEPGAANVMVWVPWMTLNVLVTGGAAVYEILPACVAVMEQLPNVASINWLAETLQTAGVVDAKLTGRPEEAVASRGIVA
jgi:hypothetical protein